MSLVDDRFPATASVMKREQYLRDYSLRQITPDEVIFRRFVRFLTVPHKTVRNFGRHSGCIDRDDEPLSALLFRSTAIGHQV